MKLLVYVPQLSPRIKYIFCFIFEGILKTEIIFSTDQEAFLKSELPKFSYTPEPLKNELFFKSTTLLFAKKITDQEIKTTTFGDHQVPFPVNKSALSFDVFATAFYFLSRYEEYLAFKSGHNDLYAPENSLQHKLNLLKFPVIDGWALILKNILLKHFPELIFNDKHFTFNPLYTIPAELDSAKKNLLLNAFYKIRGYVTEKINPKAESKAIIRNILHEMLRSDFTLPPRWIMEDHQYEDHLEATMRIPKSYVRLAKDKIKNDFSMYYPTYPGFRAGTCVPFYWYDLELEKTTGLRIHPVAATDVSLLNNKPEDLLLQLRTLIDNVKLVNGDFYFLSISNDIRPQ